MSLEGLVFPLPYLFLAWETYLNYLFTNGEIETVVTSAASGTTYKWSITLSFHRFITSWWMQLLLRYRFTKSFWLEVYWSTWSRCSEVFIRPQWVVCAIFQDQRSLLRKWRGRVAFTTCLTVNVNVVPQGPKMKITEKLKNVSSEENRLSSWKMGYS